MNFIKGEIKSCSKPKITAKTNGFVKAGWKQGYRTIGNTTKYFRSRWEANYARYLEFLKNRNIIQEWLHEPQTFWFENIKRGTRSYLPDFKVTYADGTYKWVEVKGYYDSKSLTKIKRFRKYYPNELLELVDQDWFKWNSIICKGLIPNWE